MFADWELIGVPVRVTIGDRGLKDGIIELQSRRQETADRIPANEALERVLALLETL